MPLIDRKTASRLLRVSVRTIDRYIRRGVLSARERNGRVLIIKKDVLKLSGEKEESTGFVPVEVSQTPARTSPAPLTPSPHTGTADTDFYRDLYEQSQQKLREYRHKLDQTQFQVSELQSRLFQRNAMPEATYDPRMRDQQATSNSSERTQYELREKEREASLLKESLKNERSARIIFSILTYLLLFLQPLLWYLLKQ